VYMVSPGFPPPDAASRGTRQWRGSRWLGGGGTTPLVRPGCGPRLYRAASPPQHWARGARHGAPASGARGPFSRRSKSQSRPRRPGRPRPPPSGEGLGAGLSRTAKQRARGGRPGRLRPTASESARMCLQAVAAPLGRLLTGTGVGRRGGEGERSQRLGPEKLGRLRPLEHWRPARRGARPARRQRRWPPGAGCWRGGTFPAS